MENVIYLESNGKKIIGRQKEGQYNYFVLEDGSKIKSTDMLHKEKIIVICPDCQHENRITAYAGKHSPFNKKYSCYSCRSKGEKNSFFGKKHSESFKKRLSQERKGTWYTGEKNFFYGKSIWLLQDEETREKTRIKLREASTGTRNPFYGKKHPPEIQDKITAKVKQWAQEHPEHYSKMGIKSIEKQLEGKINKIERAIGEELKERNIPCKYSKILHRKYQYDFLIDDNILLEVQGDFWHANPKIYNIQGTEPNKRKLHPRQLYKMQQDVLKKEFAEKYGYKIFYIWESEINDQNFSVIDDIQKLRSQKC